jgi:hypothetical protein
VVGAYSAAGLAGVEAFAVDAQEGGGRRPVVRAVTGGGSEPADQLGVDAIGLGGAAFGGPKQVAELQVGGASRFGPRFRVELCCDPHQSGADRGQLARLLVLGEAFADQRLAAQLDFTRRGIQRLQVNVFAFEAGNRRRAISAAATREDRESQKSYANPRAHLTQIL